MPNSLHETGLEESPQRKQRVQHPDAFRKKLQSRQDQLDKTLPHRQGKTRPSKVPAETTEE